MKDKENFKWYAPLIAASIHLVIVVLIDLIMTSCWICICRKDLSGIPAFLLYMYSYLIPFLGILIACDGKEQENAGNGIKNKNDSGVEILS